MPESAEEELARVRRELQNLEHLIAPPNPPMDLRALDIAKAKIERLIKRIAELEKKGSSDGR